MMNRSGTEPRLGTQLLVSLLSQGMGKDLGPHCQVVLRGQEGG